MAKVLIVDDAAALRADMKAMIMGMGCEVVAEACNGQEAVQAYKLYQPDLVTMDVTMPQMDGITAARSILALDPAAKIVMCSAMGQQKIVLDAIHAGAKEFIVRPFDRRRAIESIMNVLGR